MQVNPVKVGVIGAGSVLWAYLQMLDRLVPRGYAKEGPICARRRENWPLILGRRPRTHLVVDPIEVVQSDVDVVLILTSADSHGTLAALALEHGKHVLVEKPFASTIDEGKWLMTLAAEKGLHLLAAPFVQLSPTFRALWTCIQDGVIGHVHSGRGLYGIGPPDWSPWVYESPGGPMAELGIYNLKSLTAFLGSVTAVVGVETTVVKPRIVGGRKIETPVPDVMHVILRHETGGVSSVSASWEIQKYRRPALELYGTEGTANLLGDDWDPHGYELWGAKWGHWRRYESLDPTWLWTDGLRELVMALRASRPTLPELAHDLHLLEVVSAAREASSSRLEIAVQSRMGPLDLRMDPSSRAHHPVHDHTRSPEDQL